MAQTGQGTRSLLTMRHGQPILKGTHLLQVQGARTMRAVLHRVAPIAGVLAVCWLSAPHTSAAEPKPIGSKPPEWQVGDWINSKPMMLKEQGGKVVLVRWWTGDGCPFCA